MMIWVLLGVVIGSVPGSLLTTGLAMVGVRCEDTRLQGLTNDRQQARQGSKWALFAS